jgi:hypothetical protein
MKRNHTTFKGKTIEEQSALELLEEIAFSIEQSKDKSIFLDVGSLGLYTGGDAFYICKRSTYEGEAIEKELG